MPTFSASRVLAYAVLFAAVSSCGGDKPAAEPAATPIPSSVSISGASDVDQGALLHLQSSLGARVSGVKVQWNFGDGVTSELFEPSHAFSQPGIHRVSLKVSNLSGQSVVAEKLVRVQALAGTANGVCSGGNGRGWCWQSPTPSGLPGLVDWHFIDATRGWAVGYNGTIARTTDGARSWVEQESGTQVQLSLVRFADERHGWAYSNDGLVLHSADGGAHWAPAGKLLADPDASTLVPLGGAGLLVSDRQSDKSRITHDAGMQWSASPIHVWHTTRTSAQALILHGPSGDGSAGGWGRSTDGGRSFIRQTSLSPHKKLLSIGSAGNGVMWAVVGTRVADRFGDFNSTEAQELARSIDDGATWIAAVPLPDVVNGDTLVMRHDGHGLARPMPLWSTLKKPVLRTTDGGVTWRPWDDPAGLDPEQFTEVRYDSERVVVYRSDGQRMVSLDMGRTWQLQPAMPGGARFVPSQSERRRVDRGAPPTDELLRWSDFTTYMSADGGQRWYRMPDASGHMPGADPLWFFDANNGIAQEGSEMRSTRDGGRTWSAAANFVADQGFLQFAQDGTGWATGTQGLLRSMNQGRDWTVVNVNRDLLPEVKTETFYLRGGPYGLVFLDAQVGWAWFSTTTFGPTGYQRTTSRYVTADGGTTWTPRHDGVNWDSLFPGSISKERFALVSAGVGLFVDLEGRFFCVCDASVPGATGFGAGLPGRLAFQGLWFLNSREGWIFEPNRTWRTGDGGRTWIPGATFDPGNWRVMHFADSQNGWLAGQFGRVLATTDGGQTWVEQKTGARIDFASIFALDANRAWLAGTGGTLMFTSTGGR